MLQITFYGYFSKFCRPNNSFSSSQFKHDEPELNSKMHDHFRRHLEQKCRREGRRRKKTLEFGSVAKIRNLRI